MRRAGERSSLQRTWGPGALPTRRLPTIRLEVRYPLNGARSNASIPPQRRAHRVASGLVAKIPPSSLRQQARQNFQILVLPWSLSQ